MLYARGYAQVKTFMLQVQGLNDAWQLAEAVSFIGTDGSGRFGLQAGHEYFVTLLEPGLVQVCDTNGAWLYIAQPGAVLVFKQGTLEIACTEFMQGTDPDILLNTMEQRWQRDDLDLHAARSSIFQVEQTLARKIWQLNRQGEDV